MKRSLALLLAAVLGGCLSEADLGSEPTACPPFDDFADHVAPMLERRCATLDCHGAEGRPLLIYSDIGRRRPGGPDAGDPGYVTGGEVLTTQHEREGTYLSVCGLEPEIIATVVTGAAPPTDLTLVRKPRLDEKHKGGRIWQPESAEDLCLQSWLLGAVDSSLCP
jgi:hypothetical protein